MAHTYFVGWVRSMKNEGIGSSVPRREGREKLTGAALYVADQVWPGRIYGATVRSRVARGRISWSGFSGSARHGSGASA